MIFLGGMRHDNEWSEVNDEYFNLKGPTVFQYNFCMTVIEEGVVHPSQDRLPPGLEHPFPHDGIRKLHGEGFKIVSREGNTYSTDFIGVP